MSLPLGRWDPDIHAGLQRMIATTDPSGAPVATLDWDNTCIRGDISEAVLARLDEDGGGRLASYERRAEHDPVGAWVECAAALAGRTEAEASAYAIDTLDRCLRTGEIALRPEIAQLVEALHRHGWSVWVVSASLEAVVAACAARYGIPASHVVGQRLVIGADGRIGETPDGPVLYRQGKVQAIAGRIARTPTFAAGDADSDVDMLESARHRLVIGPRGPLIGARAAAGGWWVQRGW